MTPFYKSGLTILVGKGNEDKIQIFGDFKGMKISGTTLQTFAKTIEGAHLQQCNAGKVILSSSAVTAAQLQRTSS